jgi:hypothetical protein
MRISLVRVTVVFSALADGAPHGTLRAMATFKMEIEGEELSFPSEEHAARFFARYFQAKKSIAAGAEAASPKKANGKANPAAQKKYADLSLLSKFMDAIRAGGEQGANSDDVVTLLGVSDGRGIGSKLTGAKKALKELGFPDYKQVFYRIRVPRVGRFWRAGPKFKAASDAVLEKLLI